MESRKWGKICTRSLRQNIKKEIQFNPFCDKYDQNMVDRFIDEVQCPLTAEEEILIGLLPEYHGLYQSFYKLLKDMHDKYHWSAANFTKYLIALVNRDAITAWTTLPNAIGDYKELHFDDVTEALTIKTIWGEKISITNALDTSIEMINTIASYYRYYDAVDQIEKEFDLSDLKKLYIVTNWFKNGFENFKNIVWADKKIQSKQNKIVNLENEDIDQYKCIGIARLHRFMEDVFIAEKDNIDKVNAQLKKQYHSTFKGKKCFRIEKIENGQICLKKGNYGTVVNENDIVEHWGKLIISQAQLYCFEYEKPISTIENLCIRDLYALLAKLSALVKEAIRNSNLTGEVPTDHLELIHDYAFNIKKDDLIEYLCNSKYKVRQINKFLEFISTGKAESERYDFWRTMLFLQKDTYFITLHPLILTNPCQLTEYWLERCGIPLRDRGHAFEKHVKKRIMDIIDKTQHQIRLVDTVKFKTKSNEMEEIDLMIVINEHIILGELKELAFPMDAIAWGNYRSELSKGIEQVRRKAEFIEKNKDEFLSKAEIQMEIVPVVINNYPLYTGYVNNGIPIIDECTFFNILQNKPRITRKIELDDGKTMDVKKEYYYSDVNEFKTRFKEIFTIFPQIEDLKKCIKTNEYKIILLDSEINNPEFIIRHPVTK